ncbi:type II toxin-antitoxin system HipA family toxin [Spongiibacter pelagi]|nr:type II toxin-antitoxin system HipA family toxin [Spongiibacter pelagi]
MAESYDIAKVMLWGQLVGALAYNRETGESAFEYTQEWLASGYDIAPLHMPLKKAVYTFNSLPEETYKGLPAIFADTLPDDFGNAVINAWLAREGRSSTSFTPLERLLYTGTRGMGALEYLPALNSEMARGSTVALDSLLDVAQQVLDQRAGLREIIGDGQDGILAMMQVGTSAGGARPKAVVGININRTEIRSGQADLPEGFEHYLLKFDGVVEHSAGEQTFGDPLGFGRMEYAYYKMATAAGISMSHCELLEDGNLAHFMTKRFDRIGNSKLHYQSLCAMDHADYKQPGMYSYEQLFQVMRQLKMSRPAALEMYRRMVFNIVARNHDDHTKNFGFIMGNDGVWRLAPAFDVAYSYRPDSRWVNSHQLSLNGKRDNFTLEDLMAPAATFKKDAKAIIDEVMESVAKWAHFARDAGVDQAFTGEIGKHHRLSLK